MTHKTHKNWLIVTAIVIAAFGPIFALGTVESTSEMARWTLDFLSWPLDGAQTYSDPTHPLFVGTHRRVPTRLGCDGFLLAELGL